MHTLPNKESVARNGRAFERNKKSPTYNNSRQSLYVGLCQNMYYYVVLTLYQKFLLAPRPFCKFPLKITNY